MARSLNAGLAISLMLTVIGTTVAPTQAAAPKPGNACKVVGQKIISGKLTYTCTKSGSRLIWSKGSTLPLRVLTKTLPAAISGDAYRTEIEVAGGTGYHFCNLQKGSGLPPGYSINRKTCVITGVGEILSPGTTKTISPPFTFVISDSASPKPASLRVTFTITTYPLRLVITPNSNVEHCKLTKECNLLLATVTGGTRPYSFRKGSGIAPLGLAISTMEDSAYLKGIAGSSGTYDFEICVSDLVAVSACKEVTVIIDMIPTFRITVNKNGDGTGWVTTETYGISCGNRCSGDFIADAHLTLTASPEIGSVFTGWAGDCTGTGLCVFDVTAEKVVTATFTLNATGTYSGVVAWPNLNSAGRTGCEGGPRSFSIPMKESEGGQITGDGVYKFTGSRVGNTITVTVNSSYGPRGPYAWQWNRTSLSGTVPAFCWLLSTGELLNESSVTFNFARTS